MAGVDGFRHEALLYEGEREFVRDTSALVRQALADGAATLVVVDTAKGAALRSALGAEAHAVEFADMATIGRNPACIIPAWRHFVDAHPGRPVFGIGEPVFPGRSPAELVECRHHEALLNIAFADAAAFRLLCPYDTSALPAEVVAQSHGTHPHLCTADWQKPSPDYGGVEVEELFSEPLDPPAGEVRSFGFTALRPVRALVEAIGRATGFDADAVADLVLALDEVAANSLCHGGGRGTLRTWTEPGALVFQIEDAGRIADPLVGRRAPVNGQLNGRGLWMANQLSRLLQLRTSPAGTTVRLRFDLPQPAGTR